MLSLFHGGDFVEFGEILHTLRINNNLSQKELADKLEVAQASINYWEKGERTPSISAAVKIANFFGISVGDFFKETITDIKTEIKKDTTFFEYLSSIGYEIGESEYNDLQMYIKKSKTYIHLSSEDLEILEKNLKSTIDNSINLIVSAKKNI